MKIVFVSNYINHHQIPFCNEMIKLCGKEHSFSFIQTEPMEEERVKMGWGQKLPDFVLLSYTSEKDNIACRELIMSSDIVLFGGCEDESYIQPRLEAGKLTFRYSERLYREALWKWISPRGLKKKYHDHTRHNNKPVYLLCSGAYVASDFGKVKAYKNKMYKWGYFPAVNKYDIESLMAGKGYTNEEGERVPYILWAGRFLELKHPELALEAAKRLRDKNIPFHMDIVGDGVKAELVKQLHKEYGLEKCVSLLDFMKPEQVREKMEKANMLLFTSDRREGWGAVANEAMNSGCVVIANYIIGSATYLIQNGKNGWIYDAKNIEDFFAHVEQTIADRDLCEKLGRAAYYTIVNYWNPENAAGALWKLMMEKLGLPGFGQTDRNPFKFEPVMRDYPKSEKRIRDEAFGIVKPKLPRGYDSGA